MTYSLIQVAVEAASSDPRKDNTKMSTLTMPSHHHPHAGFPREFFWPDYRPEVRTLPRPEQEKIALPSIRQAIPEFQRDIQRDGSARSPPSTISPTGVLHNGAMTPPEYVHSPNKYKRRRLSYEEDKEPDRVSQVPRLYAGSQQAGSRPQSPAAGTYPAPKPWTTDSNRTSPYVGNGAFPSMRSPVSIEAHERAETRPTLPSLPLLNFERGGGDTHRMQGRPADELMPESSRRPSATASNYHGADVGGHGYPLASFGYGYQHPNRGQSLSVGSAHLPDRTPFSSGAYGPQFHETFMRMSDFGMGTSGDGKQRKRRGNLPKETTDKLRAWFVAHLHHPYPTEDEKQELMRQTGLLMNQISNWFINARRRQLPTMINNARAESDAMNGRAVDTKVLPSSERIDYDHESKQHSDSEGSNYDDVEIESAKRHRSANLKRGSI